MKRTIALIVLSILLVGSIGGAVVSQNQKYQSHTAQAQQAEADERAKERAAFTAQLDALKQVNAAALTECRKGMVAHDLLTTANKAKTPKPACPVTQ